MVVVVFVFGEEIVEVVVGIFERVDFIIFVDEVVIYGY